MATTTKNHKTKPLTLPKPLLALLQEEDYNATGSIAFAVHVYPHSTYDQYRHLDIVILIEKMRWSNEEELEYSPIGRIRYQADRTQDESEYSERRRRKDSIERMEKPWSGWYGGDSFDPNDSRINLQYVQVSVAKWLWDRLHEVIERHNLSYRYDEPTTAIAALVNIGVPAMARVKDPEPYWKYYERDYRYEYMHLL